MLKRLRLSLIILLFGLVYAVYLHAETVRIADYNLRNYLNMDRMVDGKWRRKYPKPEVAKHAIRKVIKVASPDVLVVQEIGGLDYLKELQGDLASEGLEYPYIGLVSGVDEVRHVGYFSNIDMTEFNSWFLVTFETTFCSNYI